MSFFLLGQSEDGDLHLLATTPFESRHDALAELSRLTADPAFSNWDSEVFVIDFETATPVLLVKPSAAPDLQAQTTPQDVPVAAQNVSVVEPEFETVVEETPGESAAVFEAPEEPRVEPVADEAIAQAIAGGATVEETAVSEAEDTDLRDALLRTTAHMESTGIVAPDSVGPEPSVAETPEVGLESVQASAEGAGRGDAVSTDLEGETPAWPWDVTAPAPESTEEVPEAAAAPVDDGVAFVLDSLEEPSADDADILLGMQQDAALEPSRPVILGAYDEPPLDLEPASAAAAPSESAVALEGDVEASPPTAEQEPEAPPVPPVAEPTEPMSAPDMYPMDDYKSAIASAVGSEPVSPDAVQAPRERPSSDSISDFILDLGGVTTVPEAEGAAGPAAATAAEAQSPTTVEPVSAPGVPAEPEPEYTCEDCVYIETCPNQGQRLPKDCVSFQWK